MLKKLIILSIAGIFTLAALKLNIALGLLCVALIVCFFINKLFGDANVKFDSAFDEELSVSTNPSTGAPMMASTDILGHRWGE